MICDHPDCTGNHDSYPNLCASSKEKARLRKIRYRHSEKGKETERRYNRSEAGRAARQRKNPEKRQAYQWKYNNSAKGMLRNVRMNANQRGNR